MAMPIKKELRYIPWGRTLLTFMEEQLHDMDQHCRTHLVHEDNYQRFLTLSFEYYAKLDKSDEVEVLNLGSEIYQTSVDMDLLDEHADIAVEVKRILSPLE